MLYSRGERSRWLSSLSLRLSYDPFDSNTETGYCRPPPFASCVLDYFKAITHTSQAFQVKEMHAMLNNQDFFPLIEAVELEGEDTVLDEAI